MDNLSEDEKKIQQEEPLLESLNKTPKGGFRTLPFIIANEAFEALASNGLTPNMIFYLTGEYCMGNSQAINVLFLWNAATYGSPVIGAIAADSFTGRYAMIGFGCTMSLLGTIVLWLTTFLPHPSDMSKAPTIFRLIVLYASFGLMSVGAGGIRSSSLAFGADQLNEGGCMGNKRVMESYFSWYYVSVSASVIVALSCIVYIQDHLGWRVGFGIPVLLMFFSALSFFLASPFYIKRKAKTNFVVGVARVIVSSYRNRKLEESPQVGDRIYFSGDGSKMLIPSEKLRCLNIACTVRCPQQDITPDGKPVDSWNLCSVNEVEDVKSILGIIPLWLTGIIKSVAIGQGSLVTLQAASMDRHITPNFEIPAATFGVFMIISLIIWITLYDRVIIPLASKILKKPVHLGAKYRMGIGLVCCSVGIAVLAIVECVRRKTAIQEELSGGSQPPVPLSAMWLLPHYILSGIGEATNAVGQNEFFYTELPKSMSSVALTLGGVSMSLANLVSSLILTMVDNITQKAGKVSWVSDNINEGHLDYFYWLLFLLSCLNFVYFVACSRSYIPSQEVGKTGDKEEMS